MYDYLSLVDNRDENDIIYLLYCVILHPLYAAQSINYYIRSRRGTVFIHARV